MIHFYLERHEIYDEGIIGELWFPAVQKNLNLMTLELPWKDNARDISCIPHGTYETYVSPPASRFDYPHIRLKEVEGRSGIIFHVGNFPKDTKGCILVGQRSAEPGCRIINSRESYRRFMFAYGQTIAISGHTNLMMSVGDITMERLSAEE